MAIYVHSLSRTQLAAALASNTTALLVSGPEGVGLSTILTNELQSVDGLVETILPEKKDRVDLESGSITVDSIRRLYEQTKTVSLQPRIVVIDYAERMNVVAQNAFLKLLEEPPANTRFILLSHDPELLLPTIRSRTQHVDMKPITSEQTDLLLDELGVSDPTKRAQLRFIASGLPALLVNLITNDALFAQRSGIVRDARALISGSPYDRLLLAKQYKDDRGAALQLVTDAMKQARASFSAQPEARTLQILDRLEHTHRVLTEQGNVRLQLSALTVL